MDIKEVLMSGDTTAEELLEQFKEQLATAQKEVNEAKRVKEEKERKKAAEKELDSLREDLVLTIINYLDVLGILKEEDLSDEDIDKLCDGFKEAEESMKTYAKVLDYLKGSEDKTLDTEDAVISRFLKAIM